MSGSDFCEIVYVQQNPKAQLRVPGQLQDIRVLFSTFTYLDPASKCLDICLRGKSACIYGNSSPGMFIVA